ncbi:MAG TPA: hypothetical protein VLK58_14870 [Conexibacter sp.]|nr:hypothetical protein [Conexibacter sp.]
MRYWIRALLGIVLASAAVTVVAWCTWALTRVSLCTPADETLACEVRAEGFAIAIAVCIFVAIPLASAIFAGRTKPRSSHLGLLAIGLAIVAAGGAGLWSAVGEAPSTDTTEIIGAGIAAPALAIGAFFVLAGIATMGSRVSGSQVRAQSDAVLAANGGDLSRSLAAVRAAKQSGGAAMSAGGSSTPKEIQLGTLAAQLSQMANAKERTGGDAIAARLRQLDDLRASGLLSVEEHARKRREVLDKI